MDIFIIKDELTTNLCTGISPHIVDGFTSIYEDAVRHSPMRVSEQMKKFLLDIQNWNATTVVNETRRILGHFPTLRKVLKSINYINIKSLSLMGRHNVVIDDTYISTNTPSVRSFIHRVYMNASKEFFHDVTLMDSSNPGVRPRQISVVYGSIKQVLNESVPLTDLLYNIADDDDEDSLVVNSVTKTENVEGTVSPKDVDVSLEATGLEDTEENEEEEEGEPNEEDDNANDEPDGEDKTTQGEVATATASVVTLPVHADSGLVTNSGTNVQIMLHSTLANEGTAALDETEEDDHETNDDAETELTSHQVEGFEFTTAMDTEGGGFLTDVNEIEIHGGDNTVKDGEKGEPIKQKPSLPTPTKAPTKGGPIRRRHRQTMRS